MVGGSLACSHCGSHYATDPNDPRCSGGTKQTSLICSSEPLIGQIIMKLNHSLQLMVLKQFVVAVGFESRSYIDGVVVNYPIREKHDFLGMDIGHWSVACRVLCWTLASNNVQTCRLIVMLTSST